MSPFGWIGPASLEDGAALPATEGTADRSQWDACQEPSQVGPTATESDGLKPVASALADAPRGVLVGLAEAVQTRLAAVIQ